MILDALADTVKPSFKLGYRYHNAD